MISDGHELTPVWILLGGLGQESAHLRQFAQSIRALAPNTDVLVPDYPGTGGRRNEKSPWSVWGLADAVRSECMSLVANRPVHLLGLSLGSMVALSWTLRFPGEVAGLVLVSGSCANLSLPWRRMKPSGIAAVARVALCGDPTVRAQIVLGLISSREEKIIAAKQEWQSIARDRPVLRRTLGRQLVAASTFWPRHRCLSPAPLVLAGGRDKFVDPICSVALADAVGGVLHVNAQAGHDVVLDAPDWVLEQIKAWS